MFAAGFTLLLLKAIQKLNLETRRVSEGQYFSWNPSLAHASGYLVGPLLVFFCFCLPFTQTAIADDGTSYTEPPITDDDRDHWAFYPLKKVSPPEHRFADWRRNEIDDFIAAELERNELTPQPPAAHRVLLRRLNLDVRGLPPTLEELARFVRDKDANSYGTAVERILASPGYGERWAQHWLDLARFAETDGFEHDKVRPNAWQYRDWVIKVLNDDMPYDEFLRQQIAGDEIYPSNPEALTATRFCLSCPDMPDINLIEERRHTLLNEITSTVGEVVLGLQIGCAQCHDHKYDPISQADFYRLRAIFDPAIQLKKNKSLTTFRETFPWNKPAYVMQRGDFRQPGPEIKPGVPRAVCQDVTFEPHHRDATAGRRTALAKWLTGPASHLTARVIVNRIWQHHFGTGLVNSPGDFGLMGSDPSHPELLDWLAATLIEFEWKMKPLHRLILTSATYRQRSRLPIEAAPAERRAWHDSLAADPEGRLLPRFPRRRLPGEIIRDVMLAASGQLNRKTGGPGVRPPLPPEMIKTLLKNQWEVTDDTSEHSRRSVYIFARRNLRYPIFEAFDRPSANSSCGFRQTSTTAPQSLHLLNSEFSLRISNNLARSTLRKTENEAAQIAFVFERILGRRPDADEQADVTCFLRRHNSGGADRETALTHLCLSLFNSSEFIFVD